MTTTNKKTEFNYPDFKQNGHIEYTSGYKYQLSRNEIIATGIIGFSFETDWLKLAPNGLLFLKKGYAWDGPSGPTYDTPSFMRASLVHDALYQMCRLKLFDKKIRKKIRKAADRLMNFVNKCDGMNWFRRKYTLYLVRKFAGFAVNPKKRKQTQYAPDKKHRNIIDPPTFYKKVA